MQKRIQRVDDAAAEAVFDRHQAVIDVAADDFIENRGDVGQLARIRTLLPNFRTERHG